MKRFTNVSWCAAALSLGLSACSGGSGAPVTVPRSIATGTPQTQAMHVTVKVKVPAKTASTQSSKGGRHFVSADTNFVTVTTYTGGYATSGGALFDAVTSDVSNPNTDSKSTCTFDNGSMPPSGMGSRTCSILIDAPADTDTNAADAAYDDYFTFDTYADSGKSEHLATAQTAAHIAMDENNTVSVTLSGIVATVVFVPSNQTTDGSKSLTYQLGLSAFDAAGDLIVAGAADPYSNPIAVTSAAVAKPPSSSAFSLAAFDGSGNPITAITESSDYLVATYTSVSGTTAFDAAITASFGASSTTGYFNPLFADVSSLTAATNSSAPPTFSQNGGGTSPVLAFTLAGQSAVITPNEASGATAPILSLTPSSGCSGVITVSASSGGAYTITADANPGKSACSLTASDNYGKTTTVDVTNTTTTNIIRIDAHTVIAALTTYDAPYDNAIGFFDSSKNLSEYAVLDDVNGIFTNGNEQAVVHDQAGNLFALNQIAQTGSIVEYSAANNYSDSILVPNLDNPRGIAIDNQGNLFVSVQGDSTIREYAAGATTPSAVIHAPAGARLQGIAVDSSGRIYVADFNNSKVYEYASPGATQPIITFSTNLSNPDGVFVDESTGNVYVANNDIADVVKFTPGGSSTTIDFSFTKCIGLNGVLLDTSGNLFASCFDDKLLAEITNTSPPQDIVNSSLFDGNTPPNPESIGYLAQ